MEIHHDTADINLTSGEIAELFNTYLTNSSAICVMTYFIAKAKDPDIKSVLIHTKELSESLVSSITKIYNEVKHPIPKGFSNEDVDINGKRLYSDTFMALHVRFMSRFALISYAEARASTTRADIRELLDNAIHSTTELFDMADNVLIDKGILNKSPAITMPNKIDFVEKQSFLSGFFGEKRTLNASEVNRLYLNFQRNALGEAVMLGFSQTAKDKKIQAYFLRGMELSKRHMEVTASFLEEDSLGVAPSLVQEVTDSTDTVFSDRLMLFQTVALDAIGFSTNGISITRVMRSDLNIALTKLMSEIAFYAEDGVNLMIENGWLERIPQAIDRKELISTK